jgi:hypothetical protein
MIAVKPRYQYDAGREKFVWAEVYSLAQQDPPAPYQSEE